MSAELVVNLLWSDKPNMRVLFVGVSVSAAETKGRSDGDEKDVMDVILRDKRSKRT